MVVLYNIIIITTLRNATHQKKIITNLSKFVKNSYLVPLMMRHNIF